MKYINYLLLSLIIFSCSNRDDSPNQEPQNLIITSFSPTSAREGDEVAFLGDNIDPTIIYRVSFNGIEGETTSVTDTEIVAIVPQGASSGEIVISYEGLTLDVGTIEIIEELDKLYGYLPIEGADCDALQIHNLNINTGELLHDIALLHNQSCYSALSSDFYREANIFVHSFTTRYGQGMPYGKACVIINLTTQEIYDWNLSDGADYDGSILAANDNKIYYSYRYYVDVDETYEIRVKDLDTGISNTLYNFHLDYMYDFKNSGFLHSTSELVFFTTNESGQPIFMKFNVTTSTLTSSNISEIYSNIFIATSERIFGVKNLGGDEHEIVEIDVASGNILSSLATITAREVQNIDYSLSSNSIFALLTETYNTQFLYKLNLNTGASTITPLDEQDQHLNFEGIYLND